MIVTALSAGAVKYNQLPNNSGIRPLTQRVSWVWHLTAFDGKDPVLEF